MNQTDLKKQAEQAGSRLHLIALAQLLGLSLLLVLTFVVDQRHGLEHVKRLAEGAARAHAQKDAIYRDLFIASGGAYMAVGKGIAPNTKLAHRPDRDITSADGRLFTLMIPKNLLAMASKRLPADNGVKVVSAIKTIFPLGPEDTPDAWEQQALAGLQQGRTEVSALVDADGSQVLRFIYPIKATRGCVKNRPGHGLEVGDFLGGISVTVPMASYEPFQQVHTRNALFLHVSLWLLGGIGILWSFQKIKKRDAAIFAAHKAQKNVLEELATTFDAIDDIITIQDKDMRITRVNRAACATFNAPAAELVGRYCYEMFCGTDKPCEGCPEVAALQDGILHHQDVEHRNSDKIFAESAAPICNDSGEIIGLVHYAKDITESRRQERQLRQAQKMEAIGTLAGGIAHDFNNILTAIIGFSELALLSPGLAVETREDIDQVHHAGLRAKELVKQILTFSRQAEQDFQPLHVRPVIKEALKLLRASIPTTISFEIDIADKSPLVIADPSQVHQVVMNLCTNAYHAMRDSGGTLLVSLQPVELAGLDVVNMAGLKPGPYLRLKVSDTGMGIKREDQERIFEPYFTTKKKGEGTGLGLSLVHGIVRAMGGYISVYSEEGKGTTFQVYLPVISEDKVALPRVAAAKVQMPTGKERILIVDDEESIVALEVRMLESLGYTVTAFTDPTLAHKTFEAGPDNFDLVITDMNMPHLSGLELVELLLGVRADLPIIMSTGFSHRINSKTAQKYGVKKVILKPLLLHELAQVVRSALDE
ncbi:MAG: response regulator [Proteobacteria bacterium]|nr:response regulator [Pseudomonadota bacterium]MBU1640735.1 response regulator [Pseudomonadota bacterium]